MAAKLWLHTTDEKAFASLKTEAEVREYFAKHVDGMPAPLPSDKIETLLVKRRSESGTETWVWGEKDACVETGFESSETEGWLISINGKDVHDSLGDD